MNSRYAGTMGIQRLIKEIKRDTAGGPPGPDSVGTSQIINGTITTTDICDNAITNAKIAHNAVGNTNVIDGAITHAKLSSNCIQSHNILDETILGTDISNNTITGSKIAVGTITSSNILDRTILGIDISLSQISEAHFDASFTTILEEIGDAIKELQKLQGLISIRNATTYDQGFSYTLSYKHPSTGVLTQFASYTKLNYTITASHFFKLPGLTYKILIEVSNAGGVAVQGASVIFGGSIDDVDGNNILLLIEDVNVMVEIDVAI